MSDQFRVGKNLTVPRRTFRWRNNSTNSEISGLETFWEMKSNVRLETALSLLKLKFIWGELSPREQQFLWDHPSTFRDQVFLALASAKVRSKVPLKELVKRLSKVLELLGKKNLFRKELIVQWEGNTVLLITQKSYPIRKFTKFSGYVRNSSSVGSKHRNKFNFEPIPEKDSTERFDEFEFVYEAITVGEVISRTGSLSVTLKKPLRKAKR